jgi:hypothetical protein
VAAAAARTRDKSSRAELWIDEDDNADEDEVVDEDDDVANNDDEEAE